MTISCQCLCASRPGWQSWASCGSDPYAFFARMLASGQRLRPCGGIERRPEHLDLGPRGGVLRFAGVQEGAGRDHGRQHRDDHDDTEDFFDEGEARPSSSAAHG